MALLETINLTKRYNKNTKALNDFSFLFTEGIYGLLGPNGAGKSTLMNLLTDNLTATSGDIMFEGVDIKSLGKEYRKMLGYMPQQQSLYPGFTLERFLYYMAGLKGIKHSLAKIQIPELINLVNLQEVSKKRLGTFSGGMRQRALIAQALLGDPKIIILDEPTAGLDPKERIRIRNLISEISFHKIVILATHVVSDIEVIAKNVILLKNGSLQICETPSKLCERLEGKVFEIYCSENEWQDRCKGYIISNFTKVGEKICIRIISDYIPDIPDIRVVTPVLEDVYLYFFDEESAYGNRTYGI